jgi:hypothetical protein
MSVKDSPLLPVDWGEIYLHDSRPIDWNAITDSVCCWPFQLLDFLFYYFFGIKEEEESSKYPTFCRSNVLPSRLAACLVALPFTGVTNRDGSPGFGSPCQKRRTSIRYQEFGIWALVIRSTEDGIFQNTCQNSLAGHSVKPRARLVVMMERDDLQIRLFGSVS